jgi:glycerophosphoryl diester phosphodiesterase
LQQTEHYSESREAFEVSYKNGFRAFEIDLLQLADGSVAAVHDMAEHEYGLDKSFLEATRAELEQRAWKGKYEVLFAEQLIQLMVDYPDVWLILDTKCCHEAIARQMIELAPDDSVRDRIVPHVTSPTHATALPKIYPFPEMLYARYWWGGTDEEVMSRLADFAIPNVMMGYQLWSEELQQTAEAAGIPIWVHTPAEPEAIEGYTARGVGTYTDGYITCGAR